MHDADLRTPKNPGRNDPCWCGSGKKFKRCHLAREREQRLPLRAISDAVRGARKHRQCLHPLAAPTACDRIVDAHTIQRSHALEQITDPTNHVCTFYPSTPNESRELQLHRVGWREASTFSGFCGRHDNWTFGPLERMPWTASAEQCFLVGYRALCHEVFQKVCSLKSSPVMKMLVDRGLQPHMQRAIQRDLAVIDAGTRAGLAAFERLKAQMDQQLLANDFSGWSRVVVDFSGDLCVLTTGVVSPNRDLVGRQLQVLHESPAEQESLLIGIVAAPEGGTVVLTWPREQLAPRLLIDSLLRISEDRLPGMLVQFAFAYIENTYFSARWWEALLESDRRQLASLAGIANAYYTDFDYSPSAFLPWQVTHVVAEGL
jgi:hypothetical protein